MSFSRGTLDDSGNAARDEAILEAKHKVFLSHSGAQKNFVEQVCVDLGRYDRYPFFDKRRHSLGIGEHFPEVIFQAIRQCQVGVLILSEEFFTRTKWPMLELAAMVESKKQNSELVIMPVFLGISREQCRNVENHKRWESVWLKWKQTDPRIDVEKWREALSILGPTNGLMYNEVLGEVKFREEIIEAICERVPPETRWDDSHVQGRSRLCQVIRKKVNKTQVCKSFGVRVIGLYGVGGLGKTTICKTLCNDYFKEFQGRVAHVEFESDIEVELIRGVLKKLTDTKCETLAGFDKGECTSHLKTKLHQYNVFLAIDNVSDSKEAIEQARVYLRNGFGHGSVVVITARSKEVLKAVGVAVENCIKMPKLDAIEARSLFLHQVLAVPGEINAEDDAHIMQCVELCRIQEGDKSGYGYLPLALKLLGIQSSTLGYDPKGWVEDMPHTFNELMVSVFEILRRSFDALRDDNKLLFMDVVLYFPGHYQFSGLNFKQINAFEWLSMVHQISVKCVKMRLQELRRKSVIEEVGERIGVHDLWREFARIESKAGHVECRRWVYVKGEEKSGFEHVEPSGMRWGELQRMFLFPKRFSSQVNLQILKKLRYCSNVTVLHLVVHYKLMHVELLDLSALKCLRSLVIDNTCNTESMFKVSGLGSLKILSLLAWRNGYISPTCMEDIECLTSLEFLQLMCNQCDKLPDLTNLKLLQVVRIDITGKIWKLSGVSCKLTKLQHLIIRLRYESDTCITFGLCNLMALKELKVMGPLNVEEVFNLGKLTQLEKLSISGCQSIKTLLGSDGLGALKTLHVPGCGCDCCELGSLHSFPHFSKLPNLQKLDISHQKTIIALEGLSDAVLLQELTAAHCYELREISDMGRLTNLRILDISWSSVHTLPGLGKLVSLELLMAQHCSELSEISDLQKLSNLQRLDLRWCPLRTVQGLDGLKALKWFSFQHCGELVDLPELCNLTGLQGLDIGHCSSLKPLSSLESLSNLWELKGDWQMLSKLHKYPARLQYLVSVGWGSQGLSNSASLEGLTIRDCRELDELNSLPLLPSVHSLKLKRCNFRAVSDLSRCFPNMRFLRVWSCEELRSLTSSRPLTALQSLIAERCRSLRELPDLKLSTNLKTLTVRECGVRLTNYHRRDCDELSWPDVEWEPVL